MCQYPPKKASSAETRSGSKSWNARVLRSTRIWQTRQLQDWRCQLCRGGASLTDRGDVGSAGAAPASLAGTASSSDASSRGRSGRPGVAAAAPPPPPGRRGWGEEGQCGKVFWLDAVSTTFLLEVEQAACTKSQISMCAERGAWGGARLLPMGGSPTRRRYAQE